MRLIGEQRRVKRRGSMDAWDVISRIERGDAGVREAEAVRRLVVALIGAMELLFTTAPRRCACRHAGCQRRRKCVS